MKSWQQSDWEDLIDRYVDAHNKRDIDALCALTAPGVAYYDAFWRESCVGRDFRQYTQDWLSTDVFTYSRNGPAVVNGDGAAFRYTAIDPGQANPHEALYTGAEILTVAHGKIVTISDYYFDPSQEALEEVIASSATRHGQATYATHGFGTARKSELRKRLREMIDRGALTPQTDLTVMELAASIGCTPSQLLELATVEPAEDNTSRLVKQINMPAADLISRLRQ